MMPKNSMFSYRNWSATHADISSPQTFDPEAPLSNARTPQTGALCKRTAVGQTQIDIRLDGWDDDPVVGYPVGLISLLNHNIIDAGPGDSGVQMVITDADGHVANPPPTTIGALFRESDGQFQSHLHFPITEGIFGLDTSRISQIQIVIGSSVSCGRINPFTGQVVSEPLQFGGIWTGMSWIPENGILHGSLVLSVVEQRRSVMSIGGQNYPLPQSRARTLSGNISIVFDDEALPTDESSLIDMAAYCSTSRPVICLPDFTDVERAFAQGVYGYFDDPVAWRHQPTARTGYQPSFSITEAL
jgi:hypothetical protein